MQSDGHETGDEPVCQRDPIFSGHGASPVRCPERPPR
jgi:hypothetical protein